jgi:hypothetical protein
LAKEVAIAAKAMRYFNLSMENLGELVIGGAIADLSEILCLLNDYFTSTSKQSTPISREKLHLSIFR